MTRYIDFTFLFAEPDEAEAFADDCAELEYQVDISEYDGDDDRYGWIAIVTLKMEPHSAPMTAAEIAMRGFATRHGGRYAGWA
ncbi:hypothetical protein HNQ59_000472 [Chitinivorax tropicus]|uniref:Regulator of ribonuclease activity B domain-containing protein n=1 Tax=Chitinivorax tropicus TaxID=714531 RepID=A0A840MFN1_9PROT|nr:ribonuclease E inhibitor RraB [Chitinivorax tropicus]MBB5017210.1 hypothetical protein [Chitinivorax tropicus]